ncbi:MAG: helix-turn-helix transcriptional regulator [Paludibacter sp.]|nr:helix-turn-helix transcriptional regulator [Paludibacter sp.]
MKYNKKKLIDLLTSKRISNIEIASKVDLHANMIGRIIRGESMPSLESLCRFAEYLDKDMNYFFDEVPHTDGHYTICQPSVEYKSNDPWKLLYEKQMEITQLKIENERLKNASARRNGAQAG